MPLVIVIEGVQLFDVLHIEQTLSIGRKRFNDLCLTDPTVSGTHARIFLSGDCFYIEDLGSKGGTWLNGKRLEKASPIGAKAAIEIGPFTLFIHKGTKLNSDSITNEPTGDKAATAHRLLENVLRLEEGLAGANNIKDSLATAIDALMDIFAAYRGIVFTYETGKARLLVARPQKQGLLSQRLLTRIADLKEPGFISDVGNDPLTKGIESIAKGVGSVIAAPLTHNDERLGLLYLERSERGELFSSADLSFLRKISRFICRLLVRSRERRQLTVLSENLSAVHHLAMSRDYDFVNIVGQSDTMQSVLQIVEKAAQSDVTVLIRGETGTGKELIARALHYSSHRAKGPFVAVNCMALSETIVESELFGHVKGAFSGAVSDRVGRVELAQGGTLFIDEVGELSIDVQVKLLRLLQERTFERVGDSVPRSLDIRVLAATNADLQNLVSLGKFREDLFYRINVFPIELPPLRKRRTDIGPLVLHFLHEFSQSMSNTILSFDSDVLSVLSAYDWPGNVRELRNVIQQAFVREEGDVLTAESLPGLGKTIKIGAPIDVDNYPASLDDAKKMFERDFINLYLAKNKGNVTATARQLKVSRRNLYRKLDGASDADS